MKIQLNKVGKRFGYKWILRGVDLHLKASQKYAIIGSNGSGKSTLLKIISGFLSPSEGKIQFLLADEQPISIHEINQSIAFAAPYIDLIESFTLSEAIQFHFKFKKVLNQLTVEDLITLLNLNAPDDQQIRHFSSGMQQRLKLLLAICSDTPIILLDEPTSNLDQQGVQWYHDLIKDFCNNRLVVIASNVPEDYHFCNEVYEVSKWKEAKQSS